MAHRRVGDNPLSQPMMVCCQLHPKEYVSIKFYLKLKSFHSRKCIWRCRLQKWRPSCLGLHVLREICLWASIYVYNISCDANINFSINVTHSNIVTSFGLVCLFVLFLFELLFIITQLLLSTWFTSSSMCSVPSFVKFRCGLAILLIPVFMPVNNTGTGSVAWLAQFN